MAYEKKHLNEVPTKKQVEVKFKCTYHLVLSCVFHEMIDMNQAIMRTKVFLFFRNLRQRVTKYMHH